MQFDQLRRREFIALVGGAIAWPLAARAQEAARNYRVGGLTPSARDAPHYVALFDELRRLGFIEGQNLGIDGRGYGVPNDQFVEIAVELVKTGIDAFFCAGDAATRAAQSASTTIPIIAVTDDMVGSGLVRSLANPGGNTTGVSILATELDGKRQDILMEAVPGLRRMAALADPSSTTAPQLRALQEEARARGIELSIHRIVRSEEVGPATNAAKSSGAVALNVLASPLLYANRRIIIERAAALRLPAMYQWPEIADEGGFLAYGPRLIQVFREMVARQLVKVLRGAKPTDMPIEQPTRFEFVINLRTARAIGHDVPAGLVLRADKVIE
jgi:putative tryptophan/tyrosine transport system substrate-binding protein